MQYNYCMNTSWWAQDGNLSHSIMSRLFLQCFPILWLSLIDVPFEEPAQCLQLHLFICWGLLISKPHLLHWLHFAAPSRPEKLGCVGAAPQGSQEASINRIHLWRRRFIRLYDSRGRKETGQLCGATWGWLAPSHRDTLSDKNSTDCKKQNDTSSHLSCDGSSQLKACRNSLQHCTPWPVEGQYQI